MICLNKIYNFVVSGWSDKYHTVRGNELRRGVLHMLKRISPIIPVLLILLITSVSAQDNQADETGVPEANINGTWITQSGNLVEITVEGTSVTLFFPAYARYKTATFNGQVLVYTTHYNDPDREECYIDVPDSEFDTCQQFISVDDARHRFTLTISEDGTVLSGIKEISVLTCAWDVAEDGTTGNHRPTGYRWEYHSDYQWRRANCDFAGLPPYNGNVIEKYDLIEIFFTRFGLAAEFSLENFPITDRIKFDYSQTYIDSDTGEFVPSDRISEHLHIEPLDGYVVMDQEIGEYVLYLHPYAFQSYVNLLSGLTMLCHQLNALESTEDPSSILTTQMELDSVNYVWQHRQALCAIDNELFDHHIDFLSRALQYRLLSEND